jgi:Fe-S cluster assembly protein SufD
MFALAADPVVAAQQRAFLARDNGDPGWLADYRRRAMQRFVELGVPTRRQEAWRFTDLRPLLGAGGLPLPALEDSGDGTALATHRLPGFAHRVVLLNGRFSPEPSQIGALPGGALLGSLADVVQARPDLMRGLRYSRDTSATQSFAALNAALCSDGFVLVLDPATVLEHPVEVLHYSSTERLGAHHVRSSVLAGAGSVATIVETYVGRGPGWTNAVTRVDVGRGATVRHVKVQAESDRAVHTSLLRGSLAAAARYDGFLLVAGARLSREDIQVAMTGEAASFTLNGAYLLDGDQEATIAPHVDHCARGGRTNEVLKGVVSGRAHGVFLGTLMVREGADDTDARQLNRNLMLTAAARVDTKPELTINADEVTCSHGATVGDLDDAALFYLLSRGIDPVTARHMLVEAFAAEVFDDAGLAPHVDAHVRRYLRAWLDRAGDGA